MVSQKNYDTLKTINRALIEENVEMEVRNQELMIDNSKAMLENIKMRLQLEELQKKNDWFRKI
jgi:hypothetical protein